MAQSKDVVGAALVVGGGIAGVQASLDLAESGYKVYLVENQTGIGGRMAQLDKTFPTNDCSTCIFSPKLVTVGQNPNIELRSYSQVDDIQGEQGRFTVTIRQKSRFVRKDRCKACGDCATACPVKIPNQFDETLSNRSATYRLFPQTIPQTFVIDKEDRAPCVMACPAHINVQGYVQLIKVGKYKEATELIYKSLPLPGVLGRVCPHPCEKVCRRAEKDQPISICKLKRFAADQIDYASLALPEITPRPEKVAVVGSGPGGLSAAYYLALQGFQVSMFEAAPVLGGWLRVGIPSYRLPRDILEKEIQHILNLGVEAKTNTALGRDFTIQSLKDEGYRAVFLGVGCQKGARMGIPGEETGGVIQGVDFLRESALGEQFRGVQKAVVIGGGNVAVDAARTLLRLGANQVNILYRRSRQEMPAFDEEIDAAIAEGVKIQYLAAPVEVVNGTGKVSGLKCIRMELGPPDDSGRRRPVPVQGSEFVLEVDTVIPAIGQIVDPLIWDANPDLDRTRRNTIQVDKVTYATSVEGVFAGGDAGTGPATVVEAVAAGREVAESILRYLDGADMTAGRPVRIPENPQYPPIPAEIRPEKRAHNPEIPLAARKGFQEVELAFPEDEAQREAARCLNCGVCSECMECVKVCPAQAIDHLMEDDVFQVQVGTVILSTGYEMIDPEKVRGEFSYGIAPNVLTNMEFERMLSASGPNAGEVKRPSDGHHPKKVGWIQCVGSRDPQKGMPHCSAICCMASIKEAVIAKEHDTNIEPTIFYMDMRAYGKDFDAYYERAKNSGSVRFIRSMVSRVVEDPLTHNLNVIYLDENQKLQTETFDMLVLAVGLKTSAESRRMADKLGIELNESHFCSTSSFQPVQTSRPGVFVAGMLQGPKDIPQTVMEASAAAGASSTLLAAGRNTLTTKMVFPPQRDVSGEEPRIGVFICRCGINIANVVNVPQVVEHVKTLPNVVFADEKLFTCSQDTQEQFLDIINEHKLNRVVVSACSPRTHEPMFQLTMEKAGLNPYLFTMTNIRDQCSWVHASHKADATQKAMDLARMAVARARLLAPLQKGTMKVVPKGMVLGGGVAGMTAALNLADQGFQVYLAEKSEQLGGNALSIERTIHGEEVKPFVTDLIGKVQTHPKIQLFTGADFSNLTGHVGHFKATITQQNAVNEVEFGTAIIATGGVESKPTEYLYGEHPAVHTQHTLEERIIKGDPTLKEVKNAVFIQCVGSRCEERPYCSKICCSASVRLADRLREINPNVNTYILYRDLRTYGLLEKYYTASRKAGTIYVRYDPEMKPTVEAAGNQVKVVVRDPIVDQDITIPADLLTLAAAIDPGASTRALGQLFKVTVHASGYFNEAHMKLRPVDFTTEGVFLAGLAHYPKPIDEALAQATAAAQRASIILSKDEMTFPGVVSQVDPTKCAVCLTCVRLCPYGAPFINEEHKAEILTALCQGCGICSSVCPGKAIELSHFRDDQVFQEIDALLGAQAS